MLVIILASSICRESGAVNKQVHFDKLFSDRMISIFESNNYKPNNELKFNDFHASQFSQIKETNHSRGAKRQSVYF